jgi:hypothetical protein
MTRRPAAKKTAAAAAERRLAQKSSSFAASPAPAVAAAISFGDAVIQHDDALDPDTILAGAAPAILS